MCRGNHPSDRRRRRPFHIRRRRYRDRPTGAKHVHREFPHCARQEWGRFLPNQFRYDNADELKIYCATRCNNAAQARAVESSQAGQRRDRKSRAFVQAHCPAVVDVLKNRRRAFDDCDFIVHKVTCSAGIYHNYGRNSFQNLIRIFREVGFNLTYNERKISFTSPGPR